VCYAGEKKDGRGRDVPCTDKKENKIFLMYEEIQNRAVAMSYMTNGLLILYMGKSIQIKSLI
jgi:hypothetical protein